MAATAELLPLAGGLLAAAGAAGSGWAAWQLRAAGAPLRPGAPPLVLVEEGPYRISRNPMALGLALLLAGAPLAAGLWPLALAAPVYLAWMQRVHIPAEEARLLGHFGGWYRDYAGSVRRWL